MDRRLMLSAFEIWWKDWDPKEEATRAEKIAAQIAFEAGYHLYQYEHNEDRKRQEIKRIFDHHQINLNGEPVITKSSLVVIIEELAKV